MKENVYYKELNQIKTKKARTILIGNNKLTFTISNIHNKYVCYTQLKFNNKQKYF